MSSVWIFAKQAGLLHRLEKSGKIHTKFFSPHECELRDAGFSDR